MEDVVRWYYTFPATSLPVSSAANHLNYHNLLFVNELCDPNKNNPCRYNQSCLE
jgi:hypothetical protein